MDRLSRLLQVRPALTTEAVGRWRLASGVGVGVAFALTFYLAFLGIAHAYVLAIDASPVEYVVRMEDPVNRRPSRDVPVLVGPTTASVPPWMEPFWAGLSAAIGQCVAVTIWLTGGRIGESRKLRRRRHYARVQAVMWVGLAPLVFVKLGELYLGVWYQGAVSASAFGKPPAEDPFGFLGIASVLAVLFLALEPWRGLALAYRCRWGPAAGAVSVFVLGAFLYSVGLWWVDA